MKRRDLPNLTHHIIKSTENKAKKICTSLHRLPELQYAERLKWNFHPMMPKKNIVHHNYIHIAEGTLLLQTSISTAC